MVEDDEFPAELLDALEADGPSAGFADQVMRARAKETGGGSWLRAASIPLACVFAALTIAAFFVPLPRVGVVEAESRESVELASRGVAVMEPGARIFWQQSLGGQMHVKQERGAVFYRVERGSAFVVETPAGSVQVTGTSFKVEVPVKGMKMNAVSGIVGAAMATAAWVTVYEGSVDVESKVDKVSISAGERAELRPDAAPKVVGAQSRAELARSRDALKVQVDVLEGQLKELMIAKANGGDPVVARNRQLEAELAELRGELDVEQALRKENEGENIAFPEGLSDRYREEALMRSFREVFAKTGLPGEVRAIDCSEYPCIVFGEFTVTGVDGEDTTNTSQKFFDALDAPYPEAENSRGISHSRFRTKKDDGSVEQKSVFGVTITPREIDAGSEEHKKKVNRRVRWRNQQYMDAYQ